jgi:hypothetical protein
MIILIAIAVVCLALIALLRNKGPVRGSRGSGPIMWRGGRRELTEEAARDLVVKRLRDRE